MSPHLLKGKPPDSTAHAHFDTVAASPFTVASISMREEDHIWQEPPVGIAGVDVECQELYYIDPVVDAACLEFSNARMMAAEAAAGTPISSGQWGISLDGARQLILTPPQSIQYIDAPRKMSTQVEIRYDENHTWSWFQAMETPGNGSSKELVWRSNSSKWMEQLHQVPSWEPSGVAGWAHLKPYVGWENEILEQYVDGQFRIDGRWKSEADPRYGDPQRDWNPGTRTRYYDNNNYTLTDMDACIAGAVDKPLLIEHNKWLRCTFWAEFLSATQMTMRIFWAGEDWGPFEFIGSRENPGEGILFDTSLKVPPPARDCSFKSFSIPEHNSSGPGVMGATYAESGAVLRSWYRNAVIWDGDWIDLGGRPIA